MKVATDHPLLTYIEDPFRHEDVQAFKSFIGKCKEKAPQLQIGLKKMIEGKDLQFLRELTQMETVIEK